VAHAAASEDKGHPLVRETLCRLKHLIKRMHYAHISGVQHNEMFCDAELRSARVIKRTRLQFWFSPEWDCEDPFGRCPLLNKRSPHPFAERNRPFGTAQYRSIHPIPPARGKLWQTEETASDKDVRMDVLRNVDERCPATNGDRDT
jgi:hypothetical protein